MTEKYEFHLLTVKSNCKMKKWMYSKLEKYFEFESLLDVTELQNVPTNHSGGSVIGSDEIT